MNDLDASLEFIKLTLEQLLRTSRQEIKIILNLLGLHDFLPFFNILLLSFLNDFPKLIWQNIASLVQFFFCRVVLSQVWEIITKLVKVFHKLIE